MKSIFKIEAEYLELSEILIDNGGEIPEGMEIALTENKNELEIKAVNYGFVIRKLDSEIDVISSEIERLTKLKKSRENSKEWLKKTISSAMDMFGIEKIETPVIKLSIRESKAVEIYNEDVLPSEVLVEKTSLSANKALIKVLIESGEEVKGARLLTNRNLQIK